jgi:foldase protein PrsA
MPWPAFAADNTRPSLAEIAPEVVAVVNGRDLTRDQLAAVAVAVYGRPILETLISQEVVCQEAERRGISVTEEEVEQFTRRRVQEQLDAMARRMGAKDAADLTAQAGRSPQTLEDLRVKSEAALRPFVKPELLAARMMAQEIEVTEEDVRGEFDQRYGPKVKVLQIVLGTKAEAEGAIEKLRMGADFRQLAQEVSKDLVTRRQGGEMPLLPVSSALGAPASRLKPGEISDVIQTPDGFHVLKLVDLIPAENASFDEVKDALSTEILEQRIKDRREKWIGDLIARADVKRLFQASPQ